jgi:hypothetical protein
LVFVPATLVFWVLRAVQVIEPKEEGASVVPKAVAGKSLRPATAPVKRKLPGDAEPRAKGASRTKMWAPWGDTQWKRGGLSLFAWWACRAASTAV